MFRDLSGDEQFGLQPDGTGALHRLIQAVACTRPGVVTWANAIAGACITIRRDAVITECEVDSPWFGAVARVWLGTISTCVLVADGDATLVAQHVGLGQGWPLSPGFYAVATRRARQRTRDTMRQHTGAGLPG